MSEVNPSPHSMLSPYEAWSELANYKAKYYRKYAAAYSGDRKELQATAESKSFWRRNSKCRIHVPIGADIASSSSDLLFSEEPSFSAAIKDVGEGTPPQQERLDELIAVNNLHGKLNEAAESCAALGDVYLKIGWSKEELDHPVISVVQPDSAWPEYIMGTLKAIHFFTVIKREEGGAYLRIYECYEPGRIVMALFKGDATNLGRSVDDGILESLGYQNNILSPDGELLAVHVPNIKPNRMYRSSDHGRSDFDSLRDLMDSLDEAYTSWMRDIRLAKARLIVPAEFLRRKNADLFKENTYTYEFDEDVETLVALDMDPEAKGAQITSSQFDIRSEDHLAICSELIRSIVSIAGYAPQSFGLNIEGYSPSGTALQVRERRSFNTKAKKQTYWKSRLESIMTSLVRLDAFLYPDKGSARDDKVSVQFADSLADDITVTSGAIDMLNRAAAISTEMKVRMQHPDWPESMISAEVDRIREEYGIGIPSPIPELGDFAGEGDRLSGSRDQVVEYMSGEGEGDEE